MSRRSVQMRKVANSGPIIAIRTDNGGTAYVRARKDAGAFTETLPSRTVRSNGRKSQWIVDNRGTLKRLPGIATNAVGTSPMDTDKRSRIMAMHYPKS